MKVEFLLRVLSVVLVLSLAITIAASLVFFSRHLDVESGSFAENCTLIDRITGTSPCGIYGFYQCLYSTQRRLLTPELPCFSVELEDLEAIESQYPVGSTHLYYSFRRTVYYRTEEEQAAFIDKYGKNASPFFIIVCSCLLVSIIGVLSSYRHRENAKITGK